MNFSHATAPALVHLA